MRTINVTYNSYGDKAPIRVLRDDDPFESLETYIRDVIVPFCHEYCDELYVIRCSISGWVVGNTDDGEIATAIMQAARSTRIANLHDFFRTFTPKSLAEDIEEVIQVVLTRTMLLSRPSVIYTGSIGRPAIESVPKPRQLISLLNLLVYDNGQIRAKHNDTQETLARMRKAATFADSINVDWDGNIEDETNQYAELYRALIELNAKWKITDLNFTAKEKLKLAAIQGAHEIDVKAVTQFIWGLIQYRDVHVDMNPGEDWTRKAYREVATLGFASASERQAKSNVLNPIKPSEVSQARGEKPRTAKGKVSKSKDSKSGMWTDIMGGLF